MFTGAWLPRSGVVLIVLIKIRFLKEGRHVVAVVTEVVLHGNCLIKGDVAAGDDGVVDEHAVGLGGGRIAHKDALARLVVELAPLLLRTVHVRCAAKNAEV